MSVARTSTRDALSVRVYGDPVGEISRDRHGAVHFTPNAAWLEGGQYPPLGLAFLANPRARTARGGGIPVWFENLLPEAESPLRRWMCKRFGILESDSATLLAKLGRDLPGAVEVVEGLEHEETSEATAETPALPEPLRFSLAGLQLKLSMSFEDGRFVLPASSEGGQWIVKIPGERFPELPEVEAATMTWARASGLDVPPHHVLPIASVHGVDPKLLGTPTSAFAILRFDRRADGRVHQEDFAQVLEIAPAHKYGDGKRRIGYGGLLELVGDASGAATRERLLERIAFVVASGNADAHLKNWSLQWDRSHRPRLAPCYDFVATISWPELEPELALDFGRVRKFEHLDRAALTRLVERAKCPGAASSFMAALERARTAWPAVATQAPPRMRTALAEHWRRVPLLASLGGLPAA